MRKLAVILAALALGSGLAAAQSLTVWTHFQDESLQWLQQEVGAFSAAFGVDVDVTFIPVNEIVQNMLLNAPEGEGPDLVVTLPHDQLGQLAQAGVLDDVGQYATATYVEDLGEQARLAFTLSGALYGLPMYVDGVALIVNRDLVPEGPDSLEEMLDVAQEHTTGDTFGFLQVQDTDTFYHNFAWLNGMGGYVFARDAQGDLDPADIGLASEGAVAGAQFIRDLRYEYELIPPGVNYDIVHGQFLEGNAAMIINGPWAVPDYLAAGLNVDVLPIPASEDGTEFAGFMGVQGIVMNEFSEYKIDAANLAKWLIRTDAQVSLAEFGGRIPASSGAAEQVSDDPIISGFARALANAEPMPNIPEMGAVWPAMQTAFSLILEDPNADVAAILADAVNEIRGE